MQRKGIAMNSAELELTMIEIVALSGDARTKLLNAVKKAKDGERDVARVLGVDRLLLG